MTTEPLALQQSAADVQSVRPFPLLKPWWAGSQRTHWPSAIRWDALDEQQAMRNHNQTLERLAERGGLSPDEAVAIIERRRWRPMKIEEALEFIKPYVVQL